MLAEPADIVKVAVTPERLSDCLALRDAMRIDGPHVAIAMGIAGQVTRLCPWLFGSCWTYGGPAAPGQVPARELAESYRIRTGSAATAIYGIAGAPLAHSASPAMHNAAFDEARSRRGVRAARNRDADELLAVADALGVAGVSVTAPLKPAMFERAVGARRAVDRGSAR